MPKKFKQDNGPRFPKQKTNYKKSHKERPLGKFRSSALWQKFRKRYIVMHPLCEDPLGLHDKYNETVPAQDLHHIIPMSQDMSLALDESNVMALCRECHNKIEGKQI